MAAAPDEGRIRTPGAKVFLDPIHGHIEVDPLSVKIIDTPQFQRLRNIKQLGGGYWVYPGACHNRFEHSLGVYHLAGCLITEIQSKQGDHLPITDEDVLCVKIAGLCHDLGHGPFSHLFDRQFMKQAVPGCTWEHEDASTAMFDHLIEQNGIKLEKYGLTKKDQVFIKELIKQPAEEQPAEEQPAGAQQAGAQPAGAQPAGPQPAGAQPAGAQPARVWHYKGRDEEKGFLYQIISNSVNGMDVDKWDYFARDSHYTGLPKRFDHMRLIQSARVIKVDGKWQICYRDKVCCIMHCRLHAWLNVYNMFHTRACLHHECYQHKTTVAVEMMITDALLKADDKFQDKYQLHMKISEACQHMDTYARLTDSIFDKILYSKGDKLKEARDILENLAKRKLYRFIGQTQARDEFFEESGPSTKEIAKAVTDQEKIKITAEDIAVIRVNVNYGKGKNNPVDDVRFWTKDNPDKAIKLEKEELSEMLPQKFADKFWRVYCKKQLDKESIKEVERRFELFLLKKKDMTTPQKQVVPGSKDLSGQGARRDLTADLEDASAKDD
ncbi:PREDICTED: deoxynucleoside triphosphate triphosphohydrolase SAMHD1-like [Branchiostoma belcheri]|uniref:Deoxynucleoside triphosphate triphosphohydrolase SAMHD1-like n=1 Tax=Branchiostoma belcheri TaxID=7741 RepID=A0A6P5A123_BRABE|nr:PREDICTED: deoxynucleoside triphosphate triphosphohydrolase SAMHD1-like [Branchiostoma belcheri]